MRNITLTTSSTSDRRSSLQNTFKSCIIEKKVVTLQPEKNVTMEDNFAIQLFEGNKVRIVWDEEQEKYYFSVVDIVQVLTGSTNPTDYLKKLRKRDPELGSFLGTNCPQVEMRTFTGKKRMTLAADLQGIFRIIQSIPSKKAA